MEENKFKCTECQKYYKSYQSLWNHNKRFHSDISPEISSDIPSTSPDIPNTFPTINNESQQIIKKIDKRNCDYCNKILSSYKNLHRHQQTCKLKENDKEKREMRKEIAELREMVAELIKNKSNITNNNNNTINNNNNGTINNNYITIVPFGNEKFVEVSTETEHMFILTQNGNDVIYKCIEMKHFNDKYPQFQNYLKTNNRTDESKIFDGTIQDFKIVNDTENVDDVITNAEHDIEDMYHKHKKKINNKQKDNIKRILDPSKPYSKTVENTVKEMPYNYRNKVLETHKKNRKYKSIE
jgi:hypothetical protein